jgi:hypothetical protein
VKEIVRIQTGSHLYGTATPQSDVDWTGIFLPATRDILLGRIPKTSESSTKDDSRKNLPGEEDSTWFSLHHFLRLACQGQTGAIDMLFAPDDSLEPGPYFWIWRQLQTRRQEFLSKNMNAFVGYARGQAAKYSLKGNRLNKLREFEDILTKRMPTAAISRDEPIRLAWDQLPKDNERINPQGHRELQIAGKWHGEGTSIQHVLNSVQNSLRRYGKRAHAAANAAGVDWKAMSHALRVSWELRDILSTGEIVFPLRYAGTILRVKQGQVPLEKVQEKLDYAFAEIEKLMLASSLPDAVDAKAWDDWLADILSAELKGELYGFSAKTT